MSVALQLSRLQELADVLQRERDRIASERARLLALRMAGCVAGGVIICALDPGQLQTRADASLAIIEAIENFVADRLPRLESAARAGDAAAADRAVEAARKIVGAVANVQPFGELVVDVSRFVDETVRDLTDTGTDLVTVVGVVLGGALLFKLLR